MKTRMIQFTAVCCALTALALSSGCTQVAFHQKGRLSSPLMALEDSRTETHFYQKVYYSREGSAGGIGAGAGGGCGCY